MWPCPIESTNRVCPIWTELNCGPDKDVHCWWIQSCNMHRFRRKPLNKLGSYTPKPPFTNLGSVNGVYCIHVWFLCGGTHGVQTHVVLLYPNANTWPWNRKTMSLLGYPKVIPYTKFEHFGVIRFWVMLQANKWKCIYWPCHLDIWPFNSKTLRLIGYLKIIPCTEFEHFGIIRFSYAADKQTEDK